MTIFNPNDLPQQPAGLLGDGLSGKLSGLLGDPVFNAGIAMMGSNNPSLGGSLAEGLGAARAAQSAGVDSAYKRAQIERLKNPKQNTPEIVRTAQFMFPNDPTKQREYISSQSKGQDPRVVTRGGALVGPDGTVLYEASGGSGGGPFEGTSLDAQDSNILLAGDPASPEYALAYQRQFLTPRWQMTESGMVPIMPTPPANIRPPARPALQGQPPISDFMLNPQGQQAQGGPFSVGGVLPGTASRPTEGQNTSYTFASRMAEGLKSLSEVDPAGEVYGSASNRILSAIPGVGNFVVGESFQRSEQARRDIVNAILRKESGAVISDEEFSNAEKQYFPVPGDDPGTIQQKRQNLLTQYEAFRRAAGPNARDLPTRQEVAAFFDSQMSETARTPTSAVSGWSITPVQ